MALPFIQLGQCGNQIGSRFYDIMFNQGAKSSQGHQSMLQSFFQIKQSMQLRAKAFQIDMEPKVVQKNLKINKQWKYNKQMSLVQEEGSGNNWAYGCHVHGPKVKDQLQQLFRNFAQQQDYIKAFIQIQSMAAGTGSGLGTYIVELLNEFYSKIPKFAICVMPHLSGQVILQSYNACLSLGTVYPQSDGIFIIQNDQINDVVNKQLKIQKSSLEDINQIIGRNLASVFFPVINKNKNNVYSIQQNEFDYQSILVNNLFMDSRYKLASIKTSPHGPKDSQSFNTDTWQSLQNDLTYKRRYKTRAEIIIGRGPDHPATSFRKCVSLYDKHRFYGYNRSITLLENGQQFHGALQQLLNRGYNMLKQNAYIYQYEKYGIDKDDFLGCFSRLEDIQNNYSKL